MDILLLDDNPLMQQLMSRFLGGLGYRVAIASRAADALAIVRQSPPALLLIDIHLPDLDGPEALLMLRGVPGCANIPAIAMSGIDAGTARRIITNDFDAYLPKPVDLAVLEATIVNVLGSRLTQSIG